MQSVHTLVWQDLDGQAMLSECLVNISKKIPYGELLVGRRSRGDQKKRCKDTLKASLKDYSIPTYQQSLLNRLHRIEQSASQEGVLVKTKRKESAKPNRQVLSGNRKEGNDQESIQVSHTSHQRHQRERNTKTK